VGPSSSFARCAAAARGLLLPRLAGLEGPPSRDLAAAAGHVGEFNKKLGLGWLLVCVVLLCACLGVGRPLIPLGMLSKLVHGIHHWPRRCYYLCCCL